MHYFKLWNYAAGADNSFSLTVTSEVTEVQVCISDPLNFTLTVASGACFFLKILFFLFYSPWFLVDPNFMGISPSLLQVNSGETIIHIAANPPFLEYPYNCMGVKEKVEMD